MHPEQTFLEPGREGGGQGLTQSVSTTQLERTREAMTTERFRVSSLSDFVLDFVLTKPKKRLIPKQDFGSK